RECFFFYEVWVIFPSLETEKILQVNDQTRFDARKSFVANDEEEITSLKITPEDGASEIDITEKEYLDWAFDSDGEKTVSLTVETANNSKTITKKITVLTAEEDALFSSDADLVAREDDILRYIREGRNS